MNVADSPKFVPHFLLPGGHVQTIAGVYLPSRLPRYAAHKHFVDLEDGDQLAVHDDQPPAWPAGGPAALLVHGLGGCHGSPYMVRIAAKLVERGVRVFRMDLRGWGAGAKLARRSFHAARTGDIAAALEFVAQTCPGSSITLVGFSLGGNMVLKLLAERGTGLAVSKAMAVAPPIDLMFCCEHLSDGFGKVYDRNYASFMWRHVKERSAIVPEFAAALEKAPPKKIYDFDERFTAPLGGFDSVEHYYDTASSKDALGKIETPTLILTADDDPIVPGILFHDATFSEHITLHMTDHGGHMGYISARNGQPDRRWLDWRVVDFVID